MRLLSKLLPVLLVMFYLSAEAIENSTNPKLSAEQKEIALKTWQANNLMIILADGIAQKIEFPPANPNTEIGIQYKKILSIISNAIEDKTCVITDKGSRDEAGHMTYVTTLAGEKCPLEYTKTESEMEGLATTIKVLSPELQEHTDVVEAVSNLSASPENINKGSGHFLSKSHGLLPFTVKNYPGESGAIVSAQAVVFPDFTAEVVASIKFNSDLQVTSEEYSLNGDLLTQEEVDNYFHDAGAFGE